MKNEITKQAIKDLWREYKQHLSDEEVYDDYTDDDFYRYVLFIKWILDLK